MNITFFCSFSTKLLVTLSAKLGTKPKEMLEQIVTLLFNTVHI